MGPPLLARTSCVSRAMDARPQILAVGREDRQRLRRPELVLLLPPDRRVQRNLRFRRKLGFAILLSASWNEAESRTVFLVRNFIALFVILSVGVDLPEIVKFRISENIFS